MTPFGGSIAFVLLPASWPAPAATFFVKYDNGGTFDAAFIQALNEWNGFSNFNFSSDTRKFVDPCNSIAAPDGQNGYGFSTDDCGRGWGEATLAVTWTWMSGSTIQDTDINFNENLSWGVHDNPTMSPFDFRRVAVHELGHALGLGHETTNLAIMQPIYSLTTIVPQADDMNGVIAIYGGAQSCSGCSAGPVVLTNVTFASGTSCECVSETSISLGSGVTVQDDATVTFIAPTITVLSGFHAENRARVYMRQE